MSKEIGDLLELVTPGEWGDNQGTPGGVDTGVIRSANFTKDHQFNAKEIVVRSIEKHKRQKKLLRKGDILIEKSGGSPDQPVGRVLFYDLKGEHTWSNFISILRPSKHVEAKFLYYSLCNLYEKGVVRNYQQQTTGIINLQLGEYLRESIYLPPLPEQKKIAEILSGIDRSIATNIHKITSLKTLYTSLLADSLKKLPGDCLEMQLSDACSDVFLGLTSKVDYVESEGIPLIRASNIKNGLIDFNSALHISRDQHLSLTKYRKAERGDVLVTKSGSLGECAIVQAEKEFSIYESIICLKPRSDILTTEYLFHAMQCSAVKNQFLSGRVGSAVAHLNLSAFRRITIPVPSLASQKAISKALDAVQSTRDLLRIDTDKKCFLKDALSSDLLSGRKRVTL